MSTSKGVAMISGGGTGLGFALARDLGKRGYSVFLFSRSEDHVREASETLAAEGINAGWATGDVRERSDWERWVSEAGAMGKISILINNAAGNFGVAAEKLTPKGWTAVRGIVVDGTWNGSQILGRRWITNKRGGSILNIIASYAWTGAAGVVHSATAKGGVLAMTRSLAQEWASFHIRVNALSPGIMNTPDASRNLGFSDPKVQDRLAKHIPLGRLAGLAEVARLGGDLVSDRHPYVTGDCWTVDGGLWLKGMPSLRPPEKPED